MVRKKIVIEKKTITAPTVINDLEEIAEETGKKFCAIAYEALIKMLTERRKEKEMSANIVNDRLSINSLKFEVNRLMDKYCSK